MFVVLLLRMEVFAGLTMELCENDSEGKGDLLHEASIKSPLSSPLSLAEHAPSLVRSRSSMHT
jgi:hypothetical protein